MHEETEQSGYTTKTTELEGSNAKHVPQRRVAELELRVGELDNKASDTPIQGVSPFAFMGIRAEQCQQDERQASNQQDKYTGMVYEPKDLHRGPVGESSGRNPLTETHHSGNATPNQQMDCFVRGDATRHEEIGGNAALSSAGGKPPTGQP